MQNRTHGGRPTMIAATALVLLLATVAVVRSGVAASDPPPSADEVVEEAAPVGEELAAVLGLTLERRFSGNCDFFAEVTEAGAGYCLEGVGDSRTDQVVFAEALRGVVLSPADVELVAQELAAGSG